MARNPVQFQKGISLNEFLSLYGTEQQCFDALYHWRWPNGFVCPNCGHDRGCQLTTHKLEQCYRCNRQTSITAGTIFEATKLPLTVWFQGIYFMTQDKKGASAMKLHRQLGISYNAAWRMRHKLMQVMMERDRAHPLGGFIQLDDAYLGGERSGGKRGRGAPGKTPFVAAVETNAEGHPLRVKLTVVEGFRLTEIPAPAQGSLPMPGRDSHPLDDKQGFMKSSHTPFLLDQPCLVAPDTWCNIRDDLKGIQLAQLIGSNGTIWQVTKPRPSASNRLKSLQIDPPPPILKLA